MLHAPPAALIEEPPASASEIDQSIVGSEIPQHIRNLLPLSASGVLQRRGEVPAILIMVIRQIF